MASGNKRQPGALRETLHFQRRGSAADGMGKTIAGAGAFETVFTVRGALTPLRGGETALAARLEGQQPFGVTVRQTAQTRQVTTAWQIVDAHDASRIFAIIAAPVDPDGRRMWHEILATQGVRS
ncbi:MAG: head-tail adaptor protein [Devosia sp.]